MVPVALAGHSPTTQDWQAYDSAKRIIQRQLGNSDINSLLTPLFFPFRSLFLPTRCSNSKFTIIIQRTDRKMMLAFTSPMVGPSNTHELSCNRNASSLSMSKCTFICPTSSSLLQARKFHLQISAGHASHREFSSPRRTSNGFPEIVYMGRRSEKIARRKGAQDRRRTKIFSRIGKIICMAVKNGGADPGMNKALADALTLAKSNNVPKDNIDRAISKATAKDQEDYKESTYEIYGPNGIALVLDILTDNPNRAVHEIRLIVNKKNLKIASPGSVLFNFERKAVCRIPASEVEDPDELLLEAADAGAEECELSDDGEQYCVIAEVSAFGEMRNALEEKKLTIDSAQLELLPKVKVDVSDEDREMLEEIVQGFEDIDDIDAVWTNV